MSTATHLGVVTGINSESCIVPGSYCNSNYCKYKSASLFCRHNFNPGSYCNSSICKHMNSLLLCWYCVSDFLVRLARIYYWGTFKLWVEPVRVYVLTKLMSTQYMLYSQLLGLFPDTQWQSTTRPFFEFFPPASIQLHLYYSSLS